MNYAEVAKGFTRILKQDIPFCWDEIAQHSFDRLKIFLVNAPLLRTVNYHRDFTLYLDDALSTIAMVLVQYDDDGNEHVIYYLSRNLLDLETCYAHVKRFVLATVQVVRRFRHYILLCMVTVIYYCNPMTFILSR